MTEAEKRKLAELMERRTKMLASESFCHFLVRVNPKYQLKWFHKVIARHCEKVLSGEIKRLMVFIPPQHGKQLSDSTLVPTPLGFKRHGDLKAGDYVFNEFGKPTKVLAVSDKTQSEFVVTFSNKESVECHGNHEWVVYDRAKGEKCVAETKYMASSFKNGSGLFRYRIDAPSIAGFKERQIEVVNVERKENLGVGNCIQVYGGVYLVTESYIPTHNSEVISRLFPAFALGRNPDLKIVGCSYSADLASQFSRSIQRTIDSEEYQELFSETYLSGKGKEAKGYRRNNDVFETVGRRGFYKAVGVGGGLTGTPVDIAIIDDPVKDANEANSITYRQRVWDWYNTVLTTRLHNDSKQLFIMTRWHEDDLAGRILKAEPNEWTVLSIPAICEEPNDGGLSKRQIGEALWEERHSIDKLLKQKERAPREFSALYQQHPVIEGGNIVKRDWFQRISFADFKALRFREPIRFYLDTAYNKKKKGQDNDPSGILSACRIGNYIYITHAQKVYKEMPDLLRFLPQYMSAQGGTSDSILSVEPKANGISVVQMLRESTDLNVRQTPTPTDDKEVRLNVVSPRIECGRVFLVEGSWNDDFLDEVCAFPSAPHDEFVDILGYAINDLFEDDDEDDEDVGSHLAF